MTTAPIDPNTRITLEYHGRRMHFALSQGNQAEADRIQARIDDILDNRPGVAGTAPDGEVVYDNDSWLAAQVTEAVNPTAVPERMLPSIFGPFDLGSDDDRGEPNGGGVGLLDRP